MGAHDGVRYDECLEYKMSCWGFVLGENFRIPKHHIAFAWCGKRFTHLRIYKRIDYPRPRSSPPLPASVYLFDHRFLFHTDVYCLLTVRINLSASQSPRRHLTFYAFFFLWLFSHFSLDDTRNRYEICTLYRKIALIRLVFKHQMFVYLYSARLHLLQTVSWLSEKHLVTLKTYTFDCKEYVVIYLPYYCLWKVTLPAAKALCIADCFCIFFNIILKFNTFFRLTDLYNV